MTITTPTETVAVIGGIGESPIRSDAVPKVTGEFEYSGDQHHPNMLWGATVRSPHARARIIAVDTAAALAAPGVSCVLTASDVPGAKGVGLEGSDQIVLAEAEVSYVGQPVAVIAAATRAQAIQAGSLIGVAYEPLPAVLDPEDAIAAGAVYRDLHWRRGDPAARGTVVVVNTYTVAMQDQAPLGTESGLAVPDGSGGVDIFAASQWLHCDRDQIAAVLGVADNQVRVHPTGIGGAFGAREDVNLQAHLALLAMRTGSPVKMVYDRFESFLGHVHRHPATLTYRHEADEDGTLRRIEARYVFDGGAYASTSAFVLGTAAAWAAGPYNVHYVEVEGHAAKTNNPPCGAMRGFGAVQACTAYEAQMDALATASAMDPVELRLKNALKDGDALPVTGQRYRGALPVTTVLETVRSLPLPEAGPPTHPLELPGGIGLTTPPDVVRRGVGYAVGIKNSAFPEGFDDYADARIVLTSDGFEVHTAAVEVGQGLVSVVEQIARSALGVSSVRTVFDHTGLIGSAGSSSASRQTQVTGGAVLAAAEAVKADILRDTGATRLDDDGAWLGGHLLATLGELAARRYDRTERFRHPPTEAPDPNGSGELHADVAIAAHRAVVDVDPELGLVRVVEIATAQDVGKAIHPVAVRGQIEGGIAQGIGLAVMEELVVVDGAIVNSNFTDYLIPTIADVPTVNTVLVEEPCPWSPFGARGAGEPPTVSSTAAVLAAIRAATGIHLTRAPARPSDIAGLT